MHFSFYYETLIRIRTKESKLLHDIMHAYVKFLHTIRIIKNNSAENWFKTFNIKCYTRLPNSTYLSLLNRLNTIQKYNLLYSSWKLNKKLCTCILWTTCTRHIFVCKRMSAGNVLKLMRKLWENVIYWESILDIGLFVAIVKGQVFEFIRPEAYVAMSGFIQQILQTSLTIIIANELFAFDNALLQMVLNCYQIFKSINSLQQYFHTLSTRKCKELIHGVNLLHCNIVLVFGAAAHTPCAYWPPNHYTFLFFMRGRACPLLPEYNSEWPCRHHAQVTICRTCIS